MSAIDTFRALTREFPRTLERLARNPEVGRESRYYLERIGSVRSADDLLADPRLLRVALGAWGLEDMTYARGLLRRLLVEGTRETDAFANRIADPRFRSFARAFDFERLGAATTASENVRSGVVQRWLNAELERREGARDPTMRLALYFRRVAPTVGSTMGLLADRALLEVVRGGLGLPAGMSSLELDRQVSMIEQRLAPADLRDPVQLDRLVTRFLATREAGATTRSSSIAPVAATPVALPVDLHLALQRAKS